MCFLFDLIFELRFLEEIIFGFKVLFIFIGVSFRYPQSIFNIIYKNIFPIALIGVD